MNMQTVSPNPGIPGAVLMPASLVKAGDEVCFRMASANYVVDYTDTNPIGQARHFHGDGSASSSYHPGELLWVRRGSPERPRNQEGVTWS